MPKSKKPRHPHKKFDARLANRQAQAMANFWIRGVGQWDKHERLMFCGRFLEPFAAIRFSRGLEPETKEYFAAAKTSLVLAYTMTTAYAPEHQDPERAKIAQANQLLQVAFNCWLNHKRLLYPQIKAMFRIAQEQAETLMDNFETWELEAQRRGLLHQPGFFDKVEEALDRRLVLKGGRP